MKNVKLTPAQAYALQVKADRKAAARERQDVVIAAENQRVTQMFAAN